MIGIETLFLNVLFLIFFFLFIPLLIERNHIVILQTKKKWIKISLAAAAILCSMLFPIDFRNGVIFDLRSVAVIVGGLYGGISGSLFLLAFTIISRFIIGVSNGAYLSMIIFTVIVLFLLLFINKFNKAPMNKKLLIGSVYTLISGLLIIFALNKFSHISFPVQFIFHFLILHVITALILIYGTEVIKEASNLHIRIIKAEKMEIASHLSSSISHEVRNPLAVVRGFLQLMKQNELPEEQKHEFLSICIDEIDRANDIIRNYLTFAKPAPDQIETLSVKDELEKAIGIITPLANMNSIEIVKEIDKPYFIKGDKQLLQQCLLNITKNCIEAMPGSGKLYIGTVVDHEQIVIKISDTGVGMSEEQLSRLGEPYFTTKGREGTGLGMLSVIRIIEMLNGSIKVTSKVNEGTTFCISFPIIID